MNNTMFYSTPQPFDKVGDGFVVSDRDPSSSGNLGIGTIWLNNLKNKSFILLNKPIGSLPDWFSPLTVQQHTSEVPNAQATNQVFAIRESAPELTRFHVYWYLNRWVSKSVFAPLGFDFKIVDELPVIDYGANEHSIMIDATEILGENVSILSDDGLGTIEKYSFNVTAI